MSEATLSIPRREAAARTYRLYLTVDVVMILGILLLVVYSIRLGPIVAPGVQESFGIALALMFIMSAIVAHTVDMTYRTWPLGRRVRPATPRPVSNKGLATAVKVVIVIAAAFAIAYVPRESYRRIGE